MNNQTFKNDPDNRDEKANIKLKKALRSLWLTIFSIELLVRAQAGCVISRRSSLFGKS